MLNNVLISDFASVPWTDVVTAFATVVAGIGTVGAVLVALFGQSWMERRRAPRLSLELGRPGYTPDPVRSGYAQGVTFGHGPAWPVTLRVFAAPGKRTARDVEVLLTASWTSAAPYLITETPLDHQPLQWFRVIAKSGTVTRVDIAPGASREIELLRIGRPMAIYEFLGWPRPQPDTEFVGSAAVERRLRLGVAAFSVKGEGEQDTERLVDGSQVYDLTLLVTVRDSDTVAYRTKLWVNEAWVSSDQSPTRPRTVKESDEYRLTVKLHWDPLVRVDH